MNDHDKDKKPKTRMQSNILWMIGGGYLVYLGYGICDDIIKGESAGGWGYFAVGAVFVVIGAFLVVVGGIDYYKSEKQRKKEEAENAPEPSVQETKKSRSIAERARLVNTLQEEGETEEPEAEEAEAKETEAKE